MDYIVREFGHATAWNHDNSYSFLTATSDALLSFETPQTATFHVSSLSTSNFATSYTLSALGQLDGSLSYLYSNVDLGHVQSKSRVVSLRQIAEGYRNVPLPVRLEELGRAIVTRKPTLLHATLILPPPSTLTALYARRIQPETLLSIFLDSRSVTSAGVSSPPPATVLAQLQRDTGRYSIEGLGSTDSGLLGIRGLWNFGLGSAEALPSREVAFSELGGSPDVFLTSEELNRCSAHFRHLSSKPSLLSAGAEFYYSPFSHVIGLSTGLRFTTLGAAALKSTSDSLTSLTSSPSRNSASNSKSRSAGRPLAGTSAALSSSILTPANIAHSSFPYTMTLTANPIIGSLSTTYSVKPSSNLALSSQFDFNIYSWESQYVIGAEIWRQTRAKEGKLDGTIQKDLPSIYDSTDESSRTDINAQSDQKYPILTSDFPSKIGSSSPGSTHLDETVIKMRLDDNLNVKLLWTGRVKDLLISAGVSVSPVTPGRGAPVIDEEGRMKRWTGRVGVSLAYST